MNANERISRAQSLETLATVASSLDELGTIRDEALALMTRTKRGQYTADVAAAVGRTIMAIAARVEELNAVPAPTTGVPIENVEQVEGQGLGRSFTSWVRDYLVTRPLLDAPRSGTVHVELWDGTIWHRNLGASYHGLACPVGMSTAEGHRFAERLATVTGRPTRVTAYCTLRPTYPLAGGGLAWRTVAMYLPELPGRIFD